MKYFNKNEILKFLIPYKFKYEKLKKLQTDEENFFWLYNKLKDDKESLLAENSYLKRQVSQMKGQLTKEKNNNMNKINNINSEIEIFKKRISEMEKENNKLSVYARSMEFIRNR